MTRQTKLPKSISMNNRSRTSSLANRSQDWQHRTTERSGSRIIGAMMDSAPRQPDSKRLKNKKERFYKGVLKDNGEIWKDDPNHPGEKILIDPIDIKIKTLIDRIKREQKRVEKLKLLGYESDHPEAKDRRAKILKKEGHINRWMFLLQNLNAEKQAMDAREMTKFKIKQAIENQELVRVGHRDQKLVQKKKEFSPEIQAKIDQVFGKEEE